jgi:dihydrofolate synthase / folylpolyglutamate synthase
LLSNGTLEHHPTYFETVTAMAFVLFARMGVEVAVLETGLGGRLDATNIVTPAMSVITRVDFDHESLLGRSIESIASEKAGILKPGVSAVFSAQRLEAESVLRARAKEIGSEVWSTANWRVSAELDARGSNITAHYRDESPMHVRCPLAGEHQVENAVTAIASLRVLRIDVAAIEQGIATAKWPARLELAGVQPDVILDGAHNPSGARALVAYIERFYGDRRVTLVYGAMRDKAVAEMAGILFPRVHQVIATAPAQERAARPETIQALGPPETRTASSVADALRMAVEITGADDAIFVAGSLFVVAEARSILARNDSPAVSRVPSL